MKRTMVVTIALFLMWSTVAAAQNPASRPGRRGQNRGPGAGMSAGWRLGIQLYTFNKVPFVEALKKAGEAGGHFVEGFSWHKIGPETGDAELNYKAPPEALQKAQQALRDEHAWLVGYYVGDFGKNEAESRKLFEFARTMRINFFVGEPDAAQLPVLDKLAQEYGVRIAFHNHPKDANKPEYKNWDPQQVMAMIKPYSRLIGICADTGHMVRSGLDPVEGLKMYEGRIVSLHVKDVNEKGAKGHDVPLGTGVGNVRGQLEELKRQKFNGFVGIEYESTKPDSLAEVKQSLDFLRKTAEELGVPVMIGGQGMAPGAGRPRGPAAGRGEGRPRDGQGQGEGQGRGRGERRGGRQRQNQPQ